MGNETDKRWKGRKIDWLEIADMDSEDYELKPLNQQQVAVLLMLLDYQKWTTRWENLELTKDELQQFIGNIEERLMRNEGINMTPEELAEAICSGLVCAAPKIGLMLASGASSSNTFDDDGNVVTPDTDGQIPDIDLPEDDPDTPAINETLAAQAGGAINVFNGLQEILTNMFTWFAATTPTVTSQQAETRLVLLYGFDAALATHFANYWYTVYMNSSGAVTLTQTQLASKLFCKGVSKSSIAEYIYENHATAAEIPVLEVFLTDLPDAIMATWYEKGTEVPSTDYQGYSCTVIAPETGSHNYALSNAPQYTTVGVWKPGHRFLIKLSGAFTDSDNPNVVFDGMYEHNTSTGVKTFKPTQFISNAGVPTPIQANVPFSADHVYEFTVDKSAAVVAGTCVIQGDNGSAGLPNTVGTVTIEVIDLGEFAL